MNVSARAGRNTRVSGGPIFWLFAGFFYMILWVGIALYVAAVLTVVLLGTGVKALFGHKPAKPIRETVQDAVPRPFVSTRR